MVVHAHQNQTEHNQKVEDENGDSLHAQLVDHIPQEWWVIEQEVFAFEVLHIQVHMQIELVVESHNQFERSGAFHNLAE
jgi:hypothetical protein